MKNYHEIFLGGGSVLLALLDKVNSGEIEISGNIFAYDYNETLINTFINIQKNIDEVITKLQNYKNEYENIIGDKINRNPKTKDEAKTSKESYYYYIRQHFNKMTQNDKNSCDGTALFIFINKTCFKGLYREGPNGINVPFGNYTNPGIYDNEHLKNISNLIKNVSFQHMDFSQSLNYPVKRDFVYMDPPYAPEKNDSFVGYNKKGFDLSQHKLLFDKCTELYDKKVNFVMSNSDVKLVNDSFNDKNKFQIDTLLCKRNINSKNPTAKTNEVIIKSLIDDKKKIINQ